MTAPALLTLDGRGQWRYPNLMVGYRKLRHRGPGVHIRPEKGPGTGKMSFPNLEVWNCDDAVLIEGLNGWGGNGDVLDFGGLFKPRGCTHALRACHDQNMGHSFNKVWPFDTDTVWRYERGGDLTVREVIVTNGTRRLVHVGRSGGNNGRYRIESIKQDKSVGGVVWFETDNPTTATFRVDQADFGGGSRPGDELVPLWGRQTLLGSCIDAMDKGNVVLKAKSRRGREDDLPTASLDRSVFACDPREAFAGSGRVEWRSCRDVDGGFVEDWRGTL